MNIKKFRKNKKGFTLIEIIVVVVILAVLMAVAVPSVMKYMGEADDARYQSQARGAFIATQTEMAKAFIAKTDTNYTNAYTAAKTALGASTPEVKTIVACSDAAGATPLEDLADPNTVLSYKIVFNDNAEAVVVPNGQVTITQP